MRRLLVGSMAMCAALTFVAAGHAAPDPAGKKGGNAIDVAIIGDTPYGEAQLAQFPALISAINAEKKVRLARAGS